MSNETRAVELLKRLIATPSLSREEAATADILERELRGRGIDVRRQFNNVWAVQPCHDPSKPTLLLNSHHDTVRPAPSYTRDPFSPTLEQGRLYGLGSNDAGASTVCLAELFTEYYNRELPFNLLLSLTAEEECMGEHGMRAFLPMLSEEGYLVDMALVGEPTAMQPAVGERGLIVLDCVAHGVTGHAARHEGVNAIYRAMADIETLRNYRFERVSPLLGDISVQITQIEAGRQHNVVPDECRFVVDVRTTDAYTNQETADLLNAAIESDARPRSTRVHASAIAADHPLVRAAVAVGGSPFVSPTTSDMALMHDIPSLKMGPGESSRSHSADEYVELAEIAEALNVYDRFLQQLTEILKDETMEQGL